MTVDRPIVQLQKVTRRNNKCEYRNLSGNTHFRAFQCEIWNLHIKIPYNSRRKLAKKIFSKDVKYVYIHMLITRKIFTLLLFKCENRIPHIKIP